MPLTGLDNLAAGAVLRSRNQNLSHLGKCYHNSYWYLHLERGARDDRFRT